MSKHDVFKPFGEGVRIGSYGDIAGSQELAANLSDLCQLHNVNHADGLRIEYANGSVVMLPTGLGFGADVYLCEYAYSKFMVWVATQGTQS
ncbi:MAG: hypothetical protein Q9M20_08815 [Mariprofundaceae bacterium]|nr:hypothetical protein [Mariprofundaceae bacterium]